MWTDEQIEAAAESIYDHDFGAGRWAQDAVYEEDPTEWRSEPYVNFRNNAREQARAALEAADATTHEAVAQYLDDHYLPHSAQMVRDRAIEIAV